MKSILAIALTLLATAGLAGAFDITSLPKMGQDYKADAYVRAAMELQKMGKEAACQALLSSMSTNRDMQNYYKHIILCRMLFKAKEGKPFRRPGMGATTFVVADTKYADWPLEPIELVDGVPFLISGSYRLAGGLEEADKYLQYCMNNCDWNTFQFHELTAKEKSDALDKFLKSPKCKDASESQAAVFSRQVN